MSSISISEQDLEDFKTEGLELLDLAEGRLLALDQGSDDFAAAYDEIFRAFHSLKGAAGMMELTQIQAHTHEMENLLVGTKGSPQLSKELITTFLNGVDRARGMLEGNLLNAAPEAETPAPTPVATVEESFAPAAAGSDLSDSVLDEFFVESEEILERVGDALQRIEAGSQTKDDVDALYRDVHTLKGTAYLFSFDKIGDVAHSMESALEKVRAGTHSAGPQLLTALFKSLTVLEALLKKVRHREPTDDFAALVAVLTKTLAALAERLAPAPEKNRPQAQALPAVAAPAEFVIPELPDVPVPAVEAAATSASPPKSVERDEAAGSIRVPVALLDNLMTLMGEMVLVRNQVLQYSSKSEDLGFVSMSKRLNVVTSEIQGEMMKTRMQPIGNVLSKFNRVVRDLAQELRKEIALTIHGADTELDKSLLEAIKDPLTHIVRNSCDHGIETPEKRRAAGKPATGQITVKAYHEGGQVVIEVSDDGKGLNRAMLIQKAIEKGLIRPDAKLSDKDAFELIFHAGLSTAEKVTNVSGRGVGMDVVRTNIEKIGGSVDLASALGQGTTLKIKVPLTLAIVPALIVQSGESKFAIPQVKLEELVRADQASAENRIEYLHGSPVYRLRGRILPLIELNRTLGLGTVARETTAVTIAVLNAETYSFGVIIDQIHDTADIVVKPLNRLLKSLQVYAGGTILGDGSIALILDVQGLAKFAQLNPEKTAVMSGTDESVRADAETQKLLLVKVNSPTRHALDLTYVNRLEVFPADAVEISGGQRVIRYRNTILPLVNANRHLGYAEPQEASHLSVVVVVRGGRAYGIQVDGILDSVLTTAELDKGLFLNPCFFGNLNTPEGIIVMVNPFELISREFPAIAEAEAREAQELAARAAAATPTVRDTAVTVLLVEDTAFFRRAIKQVLEEKEYRIVTANHGGEALELLERPDLTIDLIVSDIEMPVLNGFQLASAVRKHPRYSHVPMLAISSRADKEYRGEGLRAGFNTYLEKLKPPVLLAAVRELLSGKTEAA